MKMNHPVKYFFINFAISTIFSLIAMGSALAAYQAFGMSGSGITRVFLVMFILPFVLVSLLMGVIAVLILGSTAINLISKNSLTILPEGLVVSSQFLGLTFKKLISWRDVEHFNVDATLTQNGKPITFAIKVKLKEKKLARQILGPFFDKTSVDWLLKTIKNYRPPFTQFLTVDSAEVSQYTLSLEVLWVQ
ncbi:MAG: hypothetical protein R2827_04165 [Bdellovibrionales bacterium]